MRLNNVKFRNPEVIFAKSEKEFIKIMREHKVKESDKELADFYKKMAKKYGKPAPEKKASNHERPKDEKPKAEKPKTKAKKTD